MMKWLVKTKLEQVVEVDGLVYRRTRDKKNVKWSSWYRVHDK